MLLQYSSHFYVMYRLPSSGEKWSINACPLYQYLYKVTVYFVMRVNSSLMTSNLHLLNCEINLTNTRRKSSTYSSYLKTVQQITLHILGRTRCRLMCSYRINICQDCFRKELRLLIAAGKRKWSKGRMFFEDVGL